MTTLDNDLKTVFETKSKKSSRISSTGKILIGLTGGVAIGLSVICYPFVAPALRKVCLPFIPATTNQLKNIMTCLPKPTPSKLLLDIGSGDGRVVIAAAKEGFISHGVELNYWLVLYSRVAALKHQVYNQTSFYRQDLWKYNLNKYDCIVIFGVEQMMQQLEEKFQSELSSKATVVCCRFQLPNAKPVKTIEDGVDTVWVYENLKKSS